MAVPWSWNKRWKLIGSPQPGQNCYFVSVLIYLVLEVSRIPETPEIILAKISKLKRFVKCAGLLELFQLYEPFAIWNSTSKVNHLRAIIEFVHCHVSSPSAKNFQKLVFVFSAVSWSTNWLALLFSNMIIKIGNIWSRWKGKIAVNTSSSFRHCNLRHFCVIWTSAKSIFVLPIQTVSQWSRKRV